MRQPQSNNRSRVVILLLVLVIIYLIAQPLLTPSQEALLSTIRPDRPSKIPAGEVVKDENEEERNPPTKPSTQSQFRQPSNSREVWKPWKIPPGHRMGTKEHGLEVYEHFVEGQIDQIFRRTVRKGGFVCDVGMNIGYFTLLSASLGSRVFAFEPQPACHPILREVIDYEDNSEFLDAKNLISNFNVGVGKPGYITMNKGHYACDVTFGVQGRGMDEGSSQPYNISIVPLSSFVQGQHIDLIKVDVEGAEVGVTESILELAQSKQVDNIVIELMPGNWKNRGSSIEEGTKVFERLQELSVESYLLLDGWEFKFPFKKKDIGQIGEVKYDFKMSDLIQDRIALDPKEGSFTPHGCNIWFVINRPKENLQ